MDKSRRQFIKGTGGALAALPIIGALFASSPLAKASKAAPPVSGPNALKIPDLKPAKGGIFAFKQETVQGNFRDMNEAIVPLKRDAADRIGLSRPPVIMRRQTRVTFTTDAESALHLAPGDVICIESSRMASFMAGSKDGLIRVYVQNIQAELGYHPNPIIEIEGIAVQPGENEDRSTMCLYTEHMIYDLRVSVETDVNDIFSPNHL